MQTTKKENQEPVIRKLHDPLLDQFDNLGEQFRNATISFQEMRIRELKKELQIVRSKLTKERSKNDQK